MKPLRKHRDPAGDASQPRIASPAVVTGRCTYRAREDDFFCLRYQVWYPSFDCAYRTLHRTAAGCRDCDQGRFNLRRHGAALARTHYPFCRRRGD